MPKKGKTGKKNKIPVNKVPYYYKPDEMTLQEWQIALRKQAAMKEKFVISQKRIKEQSGCYAVVNQALDNEYKVVYRGLKSPWNYCSCMDFKSSQLSTCKHIEGVKLWIKAKRRKVCRTNPPYSSVYISYQEERKVCLRIGVDQEEAFRQLAAPYFTSDGVMRPEAIDSITQFLHDAALLNDTFRCYPDALEFILEQRDLKKRTELMESCATDTALDELLKTKLYPYQKEGIRFAFRAGKSIIADEMGLGKTIQAIGTAELMRKNRMVSSALIICPTSLKYQWKKEIERFTNAKAIVVEGNHLARMKQYEAEEFYKIVSYNSVCNDIKIVKSLQTDLLIMDEVQRLKNWNTQISKAARHIQSDYSVILSGTPLENKLEELYSVIQFVDQFCLGPYYKFLDQTVVRAGTGKVISYKNLNTIGEQMKDILIRRRKRDVALQLPGRIDKVLFVPMTDEQRGMHDECQHAVSLLVTKWVKTGFLSEKDRKRLLLQLSQMRMLCDSTYILDQKTRFDTKVEETLNILKSVFESGDDKVVIFSQWERMTRLIAMELDKLGVRYEYLHGGVPSKSRKDLTDNFTDLPESRVFLSTDAGSTGLNLQVASVLINLDLPWNPAVLEQRIARIYRIGQKKNIQVINLVASLTIEEKMLSTLNFKSSLFEGILDNGEDTVFLEDSKFDKIMDSIKVVIESPETEDSHSADGSNMAMGDNEEKVEESTVKPTDTELSALPDEETEEPTEAKVEPNTVAPIEDNPEQLVQQGFSFLSGLARALSSPEATKKLVDAIVDEDKETGQATLRIAVPNKESVAGILNLFGKLLADAK